MAVKDVLLTVLRNKNTSTAEFRRASDKLSYILCAEVIAKLADRRVRVETPLDETDGLALPDDVMLVSVLRAAMAILPAFTDMLPDAPVGIVGVVRDEETATPNLYYKKFPVELPRRAVIIDPMLGTAGTSTLTAQLLIEEGIEPDNIHFAGVLAAPEGIDRLAETIPRSNITALAVDQDGLNAQYFITPGLGDYGDRYYGT
ncbi:MAG: uracil phosphoribosyltransferase [Dehalococcoidia bacterium]|nr:uracil phosphoribosyltransferase [Dehalococcoidia bacterium]